MPYDPIAHRWLAYREDAGVFYMETSPDGVTWTPRVTLPVAQLFPMDSLRVELGAWADAGATAPGIAAFDNLQGGGPPTEGWCQVSSFTDDFDDGILPHAWAVRATASATGCTFAEQNGQLQFSLDTSGYTSCIVILAPGYDLTDDSVVIEVPAVTADVLHFHAWLQLMRNATNFLEIEAHDGATRIGYYQLGTWYAMAAVPYDAVAHRWWRVREQAGMVYWETSPDGLDWSAHAAIPDPFGLDALDVRVGTECSTACPSPPSVSYDNYNLPP
jgi:hypothetical protein